MIFSKISPKFDFSVGTDCWPLPLAGKLLTILTVYFGYRKFCWDRLERIPNLFAAKKHLLFIYPGRLENVKSKSKRKIMIVAQLNKFGWIEKMNA
jgi:hypothetical protein